VTKTFIAFGGQFGYVDRYYTRKGWIDAPSWRELEDAGKPPIIVVAAGAYAGRTGIQYPSDCHTDGFYDWCNFLAGWDPNDWPTHNQLECAAEALRARSVFKRRMLDFQCGDGKNLRPILVSGTDARVIEEFGQCYGADAYEKQLVKAGAECTCVVGPHSVVFDFDV
jgi:hypothetical protein